MIQHFRCRDERDDQIADLEKECDSLQRLIERMREELLAEAENSWCPSPERLREIAAMKEEETEDGAEHQTVEGISGNSGDQRGADINHVAADPVADEETEIDRIAATTQEDIDALLTPDDELTPEAQSPTVKSWTCKGCGGLYPICHCPTEE